MAVETQQKQISEDKEIKEISLPSIGKGRYIEGIGRRKTSTARVRIWDKESFNDSFDIVINNRYYQDYFKNIEYQKIVEAALKKIKVQGYYRVTVKVKGGGLGGQAEAIRLGLARALIKLNPTSEWKSIFKKSGFLTRDPREVERKKYGKRKARKEEQWQKR